MAKKVAEKEITVRENGGLLLDLAVGATVPTEAYGNIRIDARIRGIDVRADVKGQLELVGRAVPPTLESLDGVLGELIEATMPTILAAKEDREKGKRK
jgi:hypothetical protein